MRIHNRRGLRAIAWCALLLPGTLHGAQAQYQQINLIANDAKYHPQIIDPFFGDSWGVAIRPAGLGGHFWITNKNTGVSSEYLGDVNGVPLHQDALSTVTIPPPTGSLFGTVSQPTGVVFNQTNQFVIKQSSANGDFTAASKFVFVTNDGTISAWSERALSGGGFDRPDKAVQIVDNSAVGDNYFGSAITNTASGNHLYVANFGVQSGVKVFDGAFQDVSASFAFKNPFAAEGYVPFNVQNVGGSLFVAYAKSSGTPGEEEHGAGLGHLVQYDFEGNVIAVWDDAGLLNAPWGIAIAPSNFGKYSGDLLVGNFGDIDTQIGSIVAFDPITHKALGYLDDASGNPIVVPGVWGLTFGNGASLGEANSLYFAAGPNDEQDGLFGKLQAVPEPGTYTLLVCVASAGLLLRRRKRQHQAAGKRKHAQHLPTV